MSLFRLPQLPGALGGRTDIIRSGRPVPDAYPASSGSSRDADIRMT